ncbi:MAG: hypothetical protein ABH871_03470 [Pseudomonadota bacterium]
MKKINTKLFIALAALVSVLFFSSLIQAQEKPDCKHSIDAFVNLTAHFVTIPDAPPYTAEGYGTICYELDKKAR